MRRDLPPTFKVVLQDNSMSPRAPAGTEVEFTRDLSPKPGDGVLVRDRDGNAYFREYRQRREGQWEAYAYNEAYRPLDAEHDELQVIAVLTGVSVRWSR